MYDEAYRGRRVLVTGHTGFKGSWLVAWLNRLGAEVLGFSIGEVSQPSHWGLLQPECSSVLADIRDLDALQHACDTFQPEIVFHLAAQPLVRASYADPLETYATNVMGTANCLEAVRQCDSTRAVVIVTTDKCYENNETGRPFVEDDLLGGHDPYSASKAAAEHVAASYRRSYFPIADYGTAHHTLVATARAGNVIGGGDWADDRLVPDMIRGLTEGRPIEIRKPDATRPWQHVLDPLAGYLRLGERLLAGETRCAAAYNFGPDHECGRSVREIVNTMRECLPTLDVRYTVDQVTLHEANTLTLDSSKAIRELGWRPVWDSDQAIRLTARWYAGYLADGSISTQSDLNRYIDATAATRQVAS
jgi:CDP-glucose 4,6-dehydratase